MVPNMALMLGNKASYSCMRVIVSYNTAFKPNSEIHMNVAIPKCITIILPGLLMYRCSDFRSALRILGT